MKRPSRAIRTYIERGHCNASVQQHDKPKVTTNDKAESFTMNSLIKLAY